MTRAVSARRHWPPSSPRASALATSAERLAGKTAGGPARRDALVAKARTQLAKDPAAAIRTLESAADKVRKVLKIVKEPVSLETPIGDDEESSLGDFVEDRQTLSPADAAMALSLEEQTRKVLATLTPREEQILRLRFGIGEKSDYTLEEVGQRFAVTRERIRQIEAKALRKLRSPNRARTLETFVQRQ